MGITREEVDNNATKVWPKAKVPYDQGARWEGKARQDCAGYVFGVCYGTPLDGPGSWGGPSTVTAVSYGLSVKIDVDALQPMDHIGNMGPGTAGDDGHVILFVRWLNNDPNDSRFIGREQAGGVKGWRERQFDWPEGYAAYRYTGLVESDGSSTPHPGVNLPAYDLDTHELGSRLLSVGAYGTDVAELQALLNEHGAGLVTDGEFGPLTGGAVLEFQRAAGIEVDGIVGPQTLGALQPAPVEAPAPTVRPWPAYMPEGHYFGDINGPEESHGGFYPYEVEDVRAIQAKLLQIGRPVGRTGADGIFGPATAAAVTQWQRENYAATTTLYGQVWPDDWTNLAPAP